MKTICRHLLLLLTVVLAHVSASAGIYKTEVSGVFNIVPAMAGTNRLAGLLGTQFTMSVIASDNAVHPSYTEIGTAPDPRGWCFCGPAFTSSLSTNLFSFTNGHPVVVGVANDYVFAGDAMLPAGSYDVIEWGGWQYDGQGGSLNSPNFYPGINFNFHMTFIGDTGLLANSTDLPSAALDLSHVLYGTADISMYDHGVLVGQIVLDPPLRLVNGVLVGDGMSATLVALPEPSTPALMLTVVGMLALRRRQDSQQ